MEGIESKGMIKKKTGKESRQGNQREIIQKRRSKEVRKAGKVADNESDLRTKQCKETIMKLL